MDRCVHYGIWLHPAYTDESFDDDPESTEKHFREKKKGWRGWYGNKHYEDDNQFPEGRKRHRRA